MAHLKYLWYVVKHKWHVLWECVPLGIPWLGITHDLSKFLPREWFPYVNWFEGKRGVVINNNKLKFGTVLVGDPTDMVVMGSKNIGVGVWEIEILPIARKHAFDKAWLHHQNANPHHWQFWLLVMDDDKDSRSLPMPLKYAKEMLADWRGASRAQGKNRTTDVVAWYMKRRDRFKTVLHDDTRLWIESQLGICADA